MKTVRKSLTLALCAVLLVVGSVAGTMAYLTADDSVTNTFTVGKVGITLDEAYVNTDGTYVTDHDNRVTANKYHLLPGHTYIKDPTVTVNADSENAYVRMLVKVENIDQLKQALPNSGETAKYYAGETFLLQMLCVDENGDGTWMPDTWKYQKYTESTDAKTGIKSGFYEFRYKEVVEKSKSPTVLSDLFTHITVPGEIDNTHLDYLKNVKIVVEAHAIQADGFENNEAGAWAAFDGQYQKNQC